MLKNTKLQVLLVLAAGGLLGYGAATGKLSLSGLRGGTTTAAAEEVIAFEVRVPADAVLVIGGEKTAATGEVRHFETPPLEVGHYYHYDVTVRHGGKEYTRRVHLKHGGDNVFDFRSDPTPVKRGAKVARARVDSKPGKVQVTGELGSPGATTTISGNQLPPPPEPFQGKIGRNVAQSTPWWPPRVVPPK